MMLLEYHCSLQVIEQTAVPRIHLLYKQIYNIKHQHIVKAREIHYKT